MAPVPHAPRHCACLNEVAYQRGIEVKAAVRTMMLEFKSKAACYAKVGQHGKPMRDPINTSHPIAPRKPIPFVNHSSCG